MLLPYQCLLYCPKYSESEVGILIAASGHFIHTFSAKNGSHLSTWPSVQAIEPHAEAITEHRSVSTDNLVSGTGISKIERPQKRRKLSTAREDSGSSAEIVMGGGSKDFESSPAIQQSSAAVVKLACTSTGRYVVAATGEDKCIRVFEVTTDGIMIPLSERVMPKRPCATTLTVDDSTILCADKFGDVYSLPLIAPTVELSTAQADIDRDSTSKTTVPSKKSFVPSATSLTVHTKRNREALRQQQKVTNPIEEKKSLNFDHQLLLGHVSLLTDIVYVSVTSASLKPREYLLTSDRDEHIRVSRGIPQAHIVEGFCLGHTSFVSKLCIPQNYPHLLISGGGDDYILAWDWLSGSISQKIDLKSHVNLFKEQYLAKVVSETSPVSIQEPAAQCERDVTQITITNILAVKAQTQTYIVVTCEGVPGLFIFLVDPGGRVIFETSIPLEGNVVDVASIPQSMSLIYSMDTVHEPFSTKVLVSAKDPKSRPSVGTVQATELGWQNGTQATGGLVATMQDCGVKRSSLPENEELNGKYVRELVYNLESLRKRTSED